LAASARVAIVEWTCTPSCHDSEPEGNTIDSISYSQYSYARTLLTTAQIMASDNATTGLEDNQQTLQQESVTEFAYSIGLL